MSTPKPKYAVWLSMESDDSVYVDKIDDYGLGEQVSWDTVLSDSLEDMPTPLRKKWARRLRQAADLLEEES